MSMLAERRRKKKWVLLPKRAPDTPLWSTESEGLQFGQKLMEKMGWSAGKGLGAQEQGIQEPLRVSYKNDTKGMGYKLNDSEWIEQQEEFNDLLNQLSGGGQSEATIEPPQQMQIKSLEEKSMKSRTRVHYKKFTRGKDLSRYSENDLACILGTNKAKPPAENSTEKEKCPENDKEATFGVKTIHGGSIVDYFSNKWAELKKGKKSTGILSDSNHGINEAKQNHSGCDDVTPPEELQPHVRKTKKRKYTTECEVNEQYCDINHEEKTEFKVKVSKKKAKLKLEESTSDCAKEETEPDCETVGNVNEISLKLGKALPLNSNDTCETNLRKKKKKKEKLEKCEVTEDKEVHTDTMAEVEDIQAELLKKKKKRKRETDEKIEEQQEIGGETLQVLKSKSEEENEVSEIKNKRKKKSSKEPVNDEHSFVKESEDWSSSEVHHKKKDKSHKKHNPSEPHSSTVESCITLRNMNDETSEANQTQQDSKKKKKDKKKKKERTIELLDNDAVLQSTGSTEENVSNLEEKESVTKEKKKKKRNKEENNPILGSEEESNRSVMNGRDNIDKEVKVEKKKKEERKEIDRKKKAEDEESTEMSNSTEEIAKGKKTKRHEIENTDRNACMKTIDQQTEEISNQPNKLNDSNIDEKEGNVKDSMTDIIHTHKVAGIKKKIPPSVNQFSNLTNDRVLKLYCGAQVNEFRGSNLANIEGYGKLMRTDAVSTK